MLLRSSSRSLLLAAALAAVTLLAGVPALGVVAPTATLLPPSPHVGAPRADGPAAVTPSITGAGGGTVPRPAGLHPSTSLPSPWVQLSPFSAPSPRGAPAIASSDLLNETLLFGGAGVNGVVPNDTWAYAGGNWENLTATLSVSPPASAGAGLAYDVKDGYFVLFGGISAYGGSSIDQTWVYSNDTWTNLTGTTGVTPPARYAQAMDYDPALGCVVMFGGWGDYGAFTDTWEFAGGTWTNVTSSAGTPPTARGSAASTYDARLKAVVLFGGVSFGNYLFYNDTWEFTSASGGSWKSLTSTAGNAPSPRRWSAMAFDQVHGYDLLFGGDTGSYGSWPNFGDLWVLSNGAWQNVTSLLASVPSARFEPGMVFDPTSHGILLFGGCTWLGCISGYNDTWRYTWNLTASLKASPPLLTIGSSLSLTTTGVGGSFTYGYSYSGLPPGCLSSNVSVLVCKPNGTGNFTPSVNVTDLYAPSSTGWVNVEGPRVRVVARITVAVSSSSAVMDAGQPLWINATAAGGVGGYTFGYAGLPSGCVSANVTSLECTPSAGGVDRIVVTVRDAASETSSAQVNLTVNPAVSARVTTSNGVVDAGQNVTFLAIPAGGTGVYTYRWSVGILPCSNLSAASLECNLAAAGTYTISVVVNDSLGGSSTATSADVRAMADPSVSATASPSEGDAPLSVAFHIGVTGGLPPFSYNWVFGDGSTAPLGNTTHQYTKAGNYVAELWVNDSAGLETTTSVTVGVGATPTVSLTAAPSEGEVGIPVTFYATVVGTSATYAYLWSGLPAGCAASNVSTLSCTPSVAGTYSVGVAVTDPYGVVVKQSENLVVAPPVLALGAYTVATPGGCGVRTEFVNFTGHVTGGIAPFSYQWQFGDGQGSAGSAVNHTYSRVANWSASLVVVDAVGARSTANLSVESPAASAACVSPASSPSNTTLYIAVGVVVALVAVVAAFLLIRRRGHSPPPPYTTDPMGVGPTSSETGEEMASPPPEPPVEP